jgi:hypothetical protein
LVANTSSLRNWYCALPLLQPLALPLAPSISGGLTLANNGRVDRITFLELPENGRAVPAPAPNAYRIGFERPADADPPLDLGLRLSLAALAAGNA